MSLFDGLKTAWNFFRKRKSNIAFGVVTALFTVSFFVPVLNLITVPVGGLIFLGIGRYVYKKVIPDKENPQEKLTGPSLPRRVIFKSVKSKPVVARRKFKVGQVVTKASAEILAGRLGFRAIPPHSMPKSAKKTQRPHSALRPAEKIRRSPIKQLDGEWLHPKDWPVSPAANSPVLIKPQPVRFITPRVVSSVSSANSPILKPGPLKVIVSPRAAASTASLSSSRSSSSESEQSCVPKTTVGKDFRLFKSPAETKSEITSAPQSSPPESGPLRPPSPGGGR